MEGCTNPAAINYNPAADEDDGTCVYLRSVNDTCHRFVEAEVTDESFTISQPLVGSEWAFFHDYKPDFYLHTRDTLYAVIQNKLYKFNAGPFGQYGPVGGPFFIDVVLTESKEQILSALHWVTEVLDAGGRAREHQTFTHITVWNNYQCSGRIPLDTVFANLQYTTSRKSRGVWNFNQLRDAVMDNEISFLKSIFEDYREVPANINMGKPWYSKQLLLDDHFIVRLEFDNTVMNKIILHQVGATMDTSL